MTLIREEIEYTKIQYPNPDRPDPNTELPIMKLSPDLLLRLVSSLDKVTATCFGLTCRRIYGPYRRRYAVPPNLETNPRRRLRSLSPVQLNHTVTLHIQPYPKKYSEYLRIMGPKFLPKKVPHDDILWYNTLVPLWELLEKWMGPDLVWGGNTTSAIQKFVTRKTLDQLEKELAERGRAHWAAR
jgi:hypothetical protein